MCYTKPIQHMKNKLVGFFCIRAFISMNFSHLSKIWRIRNFQVFRTLFKHFQFLIAAYLSLHKKANNNNGLKVRHGCHFLWLFWSLCETVGNRYGAGKKKKITGIGKMSFSVEKIYYFHCKSW